MDIIRLPLKSSGKELTSPSRKFSPEMLAELSAMTTRLMQHYWTGDDPVAARKAQIADWIEDLREFPLASVENALREWRQTQAKRPTIADIRKLCIADAFVNHRPPPEGRDTYAQSLGYANEDERLAAIAADEQRWQNRKRD